MADEIRFEIDDAERRYLQEMLKHPGYRVFRKIMQTYISASEAGALNFSQVDPLANADAIAQKWAYVAIARDVLNRLESGVTFELEVLKAHSTPNLAQELVDRRRRHVILGELDPAPEQ